MGGQHDWSGMISLHLGGHLSYYDVQKRNLIDLELTAPTQLRDVLTQLGIPVGEIFLVVVNGEVIPLDEACIEPDDRIEIFPPMGGG